MLLLDTKIELATWQPKKLAKHLQNFATCQSDISSYDDCAHISIRISRKLITLLASLH